ncbi:hypothetical protein C1645_751441, partial [Glomus cerebriforme]
MTLAGIYMIGMKDPSNTEEDIPIAEKWYQEAIEWLQEAEKLGSIEAKLILGYMYSIGFKMPFKPEEAKKLFKEVNDKATKEKVITDKNATKETTTADKETTEEMIKLARMARRNIAILYHNSYIIKPLEWKNFIKISKPSDLTIDQLCNQKLNLAIKWYERSCELEDSQSAYHLGLLYESNFYESNDKIEENKNKAEFWFDKAIQFDENNLYAKAKLGRILINKIDIDGNEKTNGIQMLKDAAEGGLVMGQTFLGEAYERGQIGEKENCEEAIELYFKAARQNHGYYSHIAQYRLRELRALEYI